MNDHPTRRQRLRAFLTQRPALFAGIIVLILLAIFIVYVLLHYYEDWTGLGPRVTYPNYELGRTLWDWLQLLIVPAILASVALYFTNSERRTEQNIARERDETAQRIAADDRSEKALQSYFDQMQELLLERDMLQSLPESGIRAVARARTLTVLRGLDSTRKLAVLHFLREVSLANGEAFLIDMHDADVADIIQSGDLLRDAYLYGVTLIQSDLRGATLHSVDLRHAYIDSCNLNSVRFTDVNLSSAVFNNTKLNAANFDHVNLTQTAFVFSSLLNASFVSSPFSRPPHQSLLRESYFHETNLKGANLNGCDLTGARVSKENLSQVGGLGSAIMPNGAKWESAQFGPYAVEELAPYFPQPAAASNDSPPASTGA